MAPKCGLKADYADCISTNIELIITGYFVFRGMHLEVENHLLIFNRMTDCALLHLLIWRNRCPMKYMEKLRCFEEKLR